MKLITYWPSTPVKNINGNKIKAQTTDVQGLKKDIVFL